MVPPAGKRSGPCPKRAKREAFTLIEAIVIAGTLVVLTFFTVPGLVKAKRTAQLKQCADNLNELFRAEALYMLDNAISEFPNLVSTNKGGTLEYVESGNLAQHFRTMSNENLTLKALTCPADTRRPAKNFNSLSNLNVSYFVNRDFGFTSTTGLWGEGVVEHQVLRGDRNVSNRLGRASGMIDVFGDKQFGWTRQIHNQNSKQSLVGNVVLIDGSVPTWTATQWQEWIPQWARGYRLVLP